MSQRLLDMWTTPRNLHVYTPVNRDEPSLAGDSAAKYFLPTEAGMSKSTLCVRHLQTVVVGGVSVLALLQGKRCLTCSLGVCITIPDACVCLCPFVCACLRMSLLVNACLSAHAVGVPMCWCAYVTRGLSHGHCGQSCQPRECTATGREPVI